MALTLAVSPEDTLRAQVAARPDYLDALRKEKWYGIYSTEELQRNSYEEARDVESKARVTRDEFEQTYGPIRGAQKESFFENFDYYLSDPWSDQDRQDFLEAGLTPYSSNLLKRQFDTMLGEFAGRETQWRAIGQSELSDSKAEYMNHLLLAIAQQNNWQRVKEYAMRDAVIGGGGVVSCMLDPKMPKQFIRLRHERFTEFLWHIETARNGSLEGSEYIERIYWVDRRQVALEYPLWETEIYSTADKMYQYTWPYLDTLIRPRVKRTINAGLTDNTYIYDPWTSRMTRMMLIKRELFRRRTVPKIRVMNGYTASYEDFDLTQRDQAEAHYLMLDHSYRLLEQAQAIRQGRDIALDQVRTMIVQPELVNADVVDQEIWIGDRLIAVNHADDDRIPYHFLIPEFNDGRVTSYFEHSKDMQRLRNVYMSYLDFAARSAKGKQVLNEYFLKNSNLTEEEINENLMSFIKTLKINDPNPDAARAILHNHEAPNLGSLAGTMMQIVTQDIDYQGGGPNAIGLTENAGESGRAITARQRASSTATIQIASELESFEREVGEDILYLAPYLDTNIKLMIVQDGNPSWRSIAESGLQSIRDLRYQIDVVQTLAAPSARGMEVNLLRDVIQQAPNTAPVIMPLIAKKMDMDKSDRDIIQQNLSEEAQRTAELDERKQALSEYEVKQKWTLAAVDRQIRMKELELEELKIRSPRVSIGLNPEPTPALLAEQLNLQNPNLEASPLGILADTATHLKLRQDALDMQQAHRNSLMTDDQRKIEAAKAAAHVPNPVPSPEDSANRSAKTL